MKGKITEEEIEEVTHFLYFLEGFNSINEFFMIKLTFKL